MILFSRKTTAVLVILFLVCIAAIIWRFRTGSSEAVSFRTSEAAHGELLVSIRATGTIEPEEVIDVGAQVAGRILSFGNDANGKIVDYGSFVEEGTILARIDDSLYMAEVSQAEAQMQAARAGLARSEADLDQAQAKLFQAEKDWRRAEKIGPSQALSQTTFDAYQAAYKSAVAGVAVSMAAILQAKAGLAQANASLRRAQRNLSYCTITSPVKGVIIDRRVNIGQTVVASLNAPSLFLIAKDLTRIQVWVAVNEADIGKIHPGQPVTFTVDAFPGEMFHGEVGKIRLNASMTQNVVTYTVEILTDNSSGRLLPYLTANVEFELNRLDKVLQVPNAALRWTPSEERIAPEFRKTGERKSSAQEADNGGKQPSKDSPGSPQSVVWMPHGKYVRPVMVKAGLSDGFMTEIDGEGIEEGTAVVTGIHIPGSREQEASNPFAPQFARRSRNSSPR